MVYNSIKVENLRRQGMENEKETRFPHMEGLGHLMSIPIALISHILTPGIPITTLRYNTCKVAPGAPSS